MKKYAGYTVNFEEFWNYYKNMSKKVDYSQYKSKFRQCFCSCEKNYGLEEGYGSSHVNGVGEHLDKICKDTRTAMLSSNVPDKAIKHIITAFKKWFNSYYS